MWSTVTDRTKLDREVKSCGQPLVVLERTTVLSTISAQLNSIGPTWLLFIDNGTDLNTAFRDINIRFDTLFLVAHPSGSPQELVLTEVYRVAADQPLQQHWFGVWSLRSGLRTTPITRMYMRRSDLHGITLKAAAFSNPPAVVLQRNGSKYTLVGGVVMPMWSNIMASLNFKIDVRVPTVVSYGEKTGNGSWTGVVGMVQRGEVDLGIMPMINSPDRYMDVDFAVQSRLTKFKVYISELDGRDVTWSNILSPFTVKLWLATTTTALVAALILRHVFKRRDATFHVFAAIFCLQAQETSSRACGTRLVYLVNYLLGVIVLSSYSAYLTSSFTVVRPRIAFTSLQGLLEDGTFQIQSQKNSIVGNYFKNAADGLLKQIYDKHMAAGLDSAHPSIKDGLLHVCEGRYAFVCPTEGVDWMRSQLPCRLFALPESFVQLPTSIAIFPRNSPYRGAISHTQLRQTELGVISYLSVKDIELEPPRVNSFKSIEFQQASPMLVPLYAGIVLALGISVAEFLHVCSKLSRLQK